jgi:recombination protein RecR
VTGGFSPAFERLLAELEKLPGVGRKTAQRLAFHLLKAPEGEVEALSRSLIECRTAIRPCSTCFSITEQDPCAICLDPRRDAGLLCVVEEPSDVLAFERTGEFRGRYHVLMGVISPLEGVSPEDLKIRELLARAGRGGLREIILATDPDLEGEATALYVARLLKPLGVTVTRIARGLPVGGELEYADQVTLTRALEGRRSLEGA